jgi:hypothetical protein
MTAQAMSGRMTRDRHGLGPKGASAVPKGCAQTTPQPIHPSNPSEQG